MMWYGHSNMLILENLGYNFFDNLIVTSTGEGGFEPWSPHKGVQATPLSYKGPGLKF